MNFKSKKGESHLEVIFSFALFIFVLGFMIYYLVPLREQTVPDVLIDMVKEGLEEQATIKIQEITLIGDTEQATIKDFSGNIIARWNEEKNWWDIKREIPEGGAICPNQIKINRFEDCPYKCTKFDKHSDLPQTPPPNKLHVRDEYNDRLNWDEAGQNFYVERKDEGNKKKTLKEYTIYYYLEDIMEGYNSEGLNIGECFALDSYNNSISAFTKVYSEEKIKALQDQIDDPEIGPEKFKEEIFNFPKTSNFLVTLAEKELLKTAEIPEKTVVKAKEFLVEVLVFEDETEEGLKVVLRKDLAKLSIQVW